MSRRVCRGGIGGRMGWLLVGLLWAATTAWAGPRTISGEAALAGTIEEALVLAAGARVWSDNATLNGEVTVEEGAVLEVPNARSLTVNTVLRNRGVIRMWSRQNGSSLLGKGRVESSGRFEVSQVPGWGEGAEAAIGLTLANSKGGRVVMNTGGLGVVTAGGRLENAAELRIEPGGRLRFNEAEPGQWFELLEGASVTGRGELRLDGRSVLAMSASAVVEPPLVLTGQARVEGRGVLTLRAEHQLTGLYLAPLAVESNAVANVIGATFSNRVDVLAGGTLTIHNGRVMELHADLANAGLVQMSSRQNGSALRGSGRVLNAGTFQVYQVPGWGEGAEAVVALAVEILTPGRLWLSEGGFGNFTAGSKLTVMGRVELAARSRLRFDATEPARELVAAGGEFAGTGALVIDGANVVVTEKETAFPQPLVLLGKSRVLGAAALVLREGQGLTGRYEGTLRIAKGARVSIDNATVTGDVVVDEGGELVVPNARTLTLDGVCTNRGTLRMYSRQNGSFLTGIGRVENEGAFEVIQVPGWGEGAEAVVRVPVTTALTGRFAVVGAGFAAVASKVEFVVGGLLEMGRGGRLRLDRGDTNGAPRMVYRIGNKTVGEGVIQLDANELALEADATVPAPLALSARSSVTGSGRLILQRAQNLAGVYEAPLVVDAEATASAAGGLVRGPMTVQRGGLLVIPNQQRLTLDSTLVNLGTVQMWSRQNGSTLDGRGRVNNAGVFEVSQVPGWGERAEARILLLIDVLPPGLFRMNPGGYAGVGTAGSLSVSGALHIESGSLLRIDEMEPGQVLTFQKGAKNSGRGELRLDGKSRIVMAGDTDIESVLVVGQNAWVQGPGTMRLRFEQWLTGSYLGPLTVGTNGVVNVLDATIAGRALVEKGGRLGIHNGRVLRLDGELTNQGTIEMASRQNGSVLEGKGRMENLGSFEVYQVPGWGENAEAHVRIPVTVGGAGRLLVKSGGLFNWTGAGSLEVLGEVEVQASGRLRFDGTEPGRDLVANGGRFLGPGQIRFDAATRFVVNLETRLPSALSLADTARVIANAPLVLADGQTLTGGYDGTLVVSKGASVTIDQARTTGLVRVESGGLVIVPNGRTWFLDGPLTNRGTIRMYSRQNGTTLQGRGRVDNAGAFEVLQVPGWGEAAEAIVRVPCKTWEPGRFVVAAGGFGAVSGPVDFVVASALELAGGGRLRLTPGDASPAPRLVMQAGNRCAGDGNLVLDNNELWLEADTAMPMPLLMAAASSAAGPGQLVLQRNQNLSGRYHAPIALDEGAVVGAGGGVIQGMLTVRKGAVLTVHNAQVLTIHGALRNEGTLRLSSRQNGSRIEGSGRIENEALIEVNQVPGWGEGAEAAFMVPVQGGVTSSFVVNGGGFAAVLAPGELLGSGNVRVLDRLRLAGAMRYHGTVEVRGALVLNDAQSSFQVLNTLTFARDAFLSNPGNVCGAPLVADGGLRLSGRPPASGCADRGAVPLFAILANQTAPAGLPTPAYAFGLADADSASGALRLTAASSDTNLVDAAAIRVTMGAGGGALTATPASKRAGSTLVTLTATDAEGNRAFRAFNLAFSGFEAPAENRPPTVSPIAGVSLEQGQTRDVRFTVVDAETAAASLEVTVTSSAPSLFPTLATGLTGEGSERVLRIVPAPGAAGTAFITVTVRDAGGAEGRASFQCAVVAVDDTDSDDDGVPDVKELRAGTDPRNKRDFFGFPEAPKPRLGGAWSITINTVPGRTYVLQSADLSAGLRWTEVARVRASGVVTTLEDPTSVASRSRIYRTVLVEERPADEVPPQIASLSVTPESPGRYRLNVTANDASGIRSVEFFDGAMSLGRAVAGSNETWSLVAPLPMNSIHQLRALATDLAGNSGSTDDRGVFLADPNYVAPLGADGMARYGDVVMLGADGRLPAVEVRPAGPDPLGAGNRFGIRAAAGGRVLVTSTGPVLELENATAAFGITAAFRLPEPLARTDGGSVRLPVGPMSVEQILAAFGRPPNEGLPVLIFGRIPVRWMQGTLEPGGIRGGRFKLELPGIPVPGDSVRVADLVLELDSRRGIRLPFSGEVELPNRTDGTVRLAIPASRPLVLLVRPDGSMAVEGRGTLGFKEGPRFTVDVALNDPYYALQISAEKLQLPMLDSLYPRLPAPGAAPGTSSTAAQLDEAARQLAAVWCAYRHFASSAAPCAGDVAGATAPLGLPPTPASMLEAWAYAARADSGLVGTMLGQAELFAQTARSVLASRDLVVACQYHLALLRARLTASTVQAGVIEPHLRSARQALVRLAGDPQAVSDLATMSAMAACLLEAEAISQQVGAATADPALQSAVRSLVTRFVDGEVGRYAIVDGPQGPSSGLVAEMDRYQALQALMDTLAVQRLAQQIGADSTLVVGALRRIAQVLGTHTWRLANEALTAAETARDYPQFTAALAEAMAVIGAAQSGAFDEAALGSPSTLGLLQGAAARLEGVYRSDLNKGFRVEHLASVLKELRGMLAVLRDARTPVEPWRPWAQTLFNRCDAVVGQAILRQRAEPGALSGQDLVTLLCVGTLQAELGERFGFAGQAAWEGERLGQVVGFLRDAPGRTWVNLHEAVDCLLTEAAQMRGMGAQAQGRRQASLAAATALLATERELVSAHWAASKACTDSAWTALADMVLPGDILVDEVAGAASFHRETRLLRGAFRGRMRIPGFGGEFAVNNASFDTTGAFDLSATGGLALPSAEDARLRLTVPADRPLHIAVRPPGRVAMSGSLKVDLNGMAFEAYASLDDPIYVVGAAARGLQFDVMNAIKPLLPTLDPNRVLSPAALMELSELYASFAGGMQGVATPVTAPGLRLASASLHSGSEDSGQVPELTADFELPIPESPVQPARAWLQSLLADAVLSAPRDFNATLGLFTNQLQSLRKSIASAAFRRADFSSLQGMSNDVALLEKVIRVTKDADHPLRQNTQGLLNEPQFRGYVEDIGLFLSSQLRASRFVADPKEQVRVELLLALNLRFLAAVKDFQWYSPAALEAAVQLFLAAGSGTFETFGISWETGQALADRRRLESLTSGQLKAGLQSIVMIWRHYQLEGLEDPEGTLLTRYTSAAGVLRARLWEIYMGQLTNSVVPWEPVAMHAALARLHPFPTNNLLIWRTDPRLGASEPLLETYRQINRLTKGLLELVAVGQLLNLDPLTDSETQDAVHAYVLAQQFADNLKPDGRNNYQPKFYSLQVRRWETSRSGERHLRTCRPDLEALTSGLTKQIVETMPPEVVALHDAAVRLSVQCVMDQLEEDAFSPRAAQLLVKTLEEILTLATVRGPDAASRVASAAESVGWLLAEAFPSPGPAGRAAPLSLGGAPPSVAETAAIVALLLEALEIPEFAQHAGMRETLLREANRLVRVQAAQAASLASRLLPAPPLDMLLPGGVNIDSVFGELTFDRSARSLAGRFGGRLEFPSLGGASFEVTEATLDSAFNFSLLATASGLRLGSAELMQGTLRVNGSPGQRYFAFAGSGRMRFGGGTDVGVSIAYLPETRELVFASDVDNATGVFRLSDNLVLFKAGLGLRLSTERPAGELTNSATVGLFARRPLSDPPQEDDFHMVVRNARTVLSTDLTTLRGTFTIAGGELLLPAGFTAGICDAGDSTSGTPSPTRPLIGIHPDRPITAALTLRPGSTAASLLIESLTLGGSVTVERVGMRPPGLAGFGAEICRGELVFPGLQLGGGVLPTATLPKFALFEGTVSVPLPPGQTNYLVATNVVFDLEGLPTGTVFLRDDVRLMDLSAFNFTLLGGDSCGAGLPATGLRVARERDRLAVTLSGGVRVGIPASVLSTNGASAGASASAAGASTGGTTNGVEMTACASVILREGALPELDVRILGIAGNFNLGGSIPIEGASITLSNLHQIFNLSPDLPDPFTIMVAGTIFAPNGPGFGLRDTRFVFNNLQPDLPGLPQFIPGTLLYDGSRWALRQYLPIFVERAEFTFKDGTRSFPEILNPTNLVITTTASISLPTPTDPVLGGSVRDLSVTFLGDGTPVFSLDGLGLDIQPGKLKLPPINDLGGRLYIGGLSDPVHHPERLFFAGKLTGTYSEMKLGFLGAFKLTGPIGICLDVKGGSLGIPLPLGFSINGASGGISLLNNNSNPCDIRGYIDSQSGRPTGEPPADAVPLSWTQVKQLVDRFEQRARQLEQSARPSQSIDGGKPPQVSLLSASALPSGASAADQDIDRAGEPAFESEPHVAPSLAAPHSGGLTIPCPGDCPPYTVNIFCQPHPDTARFGRRVILKFSSIEESVLNRFGITEQSLQSLLDQGIRSSSGLGAALARQMKTNIMASVKLPPAATPATALFDELFTNFENGMAQAIQTALGATPGAAGVIYSNVAYTAYAGLPCQDVTYVVSGSFSHSAIGMFLSITGEGLLSTSGTAGVSGRVNFIGLPVGTGKVFVTGTDDRGLLNPALCGEINVAVGPLDLGSLKAGLQCDGCIAGLTQIAANLVVGLGGEVVRNILREIAPELAELSQAQLAALIVSGPQSINGVTMSFPVELQTAFLGVLLQAGPEILPANAREQFIEAVDQALDVFNPEFLLCGQVLPKLFGIPMGTKAASVSYRVSRDGRQAVVGFAPSTILRWLTDPRFAPPEFDAATLGYNEPLPAEEFKAAILAGLRGDLLDPQRAARFAKEQFGRFLERNTMTTTYELTPLGLSLARAAGRAVMPDFTRHPVAHGFTRPEARGLPSRPQLLMAMLRAEPPVLGNPFWFGRDNDLSGLYPVGSSTAIQLAGKSLTRDYFPHGGFVGAGYIDVPRALYDPPPAELATALNPQTNAFARLAAALTYVTEYVLKTTNAGQLAFYLPAPNPPRDLVQAPEVDVEAVLNALSRFQPPPTGLHGLNQQIYPIQEAFLGGFLSNRVLGVDIGTATIEGVPPGNGRDAYLRGDATMSNDPRNWLRHFASQAAIRFEIAQSPTQSVQRAFGEWRNVLAQPTNGLTAAAVTARLTPFLNRFYDEMPKGSLTATLTGVGLSQTVRDRLGRLLTIPPGSGDFELAAYSPRFNPNETALNPMAVIRKNGGVAMRGRLSLGNLVTNTIEVAVLPKPYDPLATPPDLLADVSVPSLPLAPGLTLSQAALQLDTRAPSLTVTGQVSTIDLGPLLRIQPLTGSQLTAGFTMAPAGQGVQLSLPPSQIQSSFLLGSGRSLLIHGSASTTTPFTFSTTSEWSASVSFRDNQPLELRAPDGKILMRVARNDVGTMSMRRFLENNAWVAEVRIDIPSGREVIFLPGDALEQKFRFGAAQTLVARSDGAARLTGTLQTTLALAGLGGLPVQQVQSAATVTFERLVTARTADGTPSAFEVRLTATGSLGGGMLRAGTVSAANSQLRIALPGGVSLSGSVSVPGLDFGGFSLAPSGSTAFDALLDLNGLRIASTTACLSVGGNPIACFPLNAVGTASASNRGEGGAVALASSAQPQALRVLVPTTNNFSINSGSVNATLFNYQLGSASFTLVRRAGVVSLSPFVGTLTLPVIGGSSRVRGDIQSDGLFRLESEQAFNVPSITGQAIGSLSSARAVLRRYLQPRSGPGGVELPPIPANSLRLEGNMAGGALSQFSPLGTASGWLELTSTAIADGELSLGGIGFGTTGLALRAADGQPLTAEIDAAVLKWNARPVRLTYNNATVCDFDLPGFGGLGGRVDLRNTLPATGDWSWNVGPTTAMFHGISLGSANFLLGRQGGVLGLHSFSGSTASFPLIGSMSFSGKLVTSSLDLRASPALAKIGGFDTAHVEFQITSDGIVQRNKIELSIGKIGWVGCDSFKVSSSGLSFKGKRGPIDSGWERKFNFETPFSDPRGSDIYGRIRYDLEFDVSNFTAGSLSLRVSGTVGVWVDPGAGDQPGSVFDVPLRVTLPIPPASSLQLTSPNIEVPLPGGAEWQPVRDRLSNLKFTLW